MHAVDQVRLIAPSIRFVQVPFIFISVVLTILPLLPACVYFLVAQEDITPQQRALQVPQLILVLASIVFGMSAVRLHMPACTASAHPVSVFRGGLVTYASAETSCMWLSKLSGRTLSAIDCVQLKQAYQAARRQQHFAPMRQGSGDTDKLEGDFGVTRTSKNVLRALRPDGKVAWNAHEPPQGQTQPLIQAGEEQSTRIHASANPLWQSEEHADT